MSDYNPRDERRANYPHRLTIPTRWLDIDMYQHVNNVNFYAYFDTVIGEYLVREGGLNYEDSAQVGFAVETHCQFLQPVKFPDVLDACLRVSKLGNSSCRYEIGIFKQGEEQPAAVGYFVHVFVDRTGDNPVPKPITGQLRDALEKLVVS
ncbi:MAG: thioesterase family protein [Chloroflexota bacterium]